MVANRLAMVLHAVLSGLEYACLAAWLLPITASNQAVVLSNSSVIADPSRNGKVPMYGSWPVQLQQHSEVP